MTSSGRILNLFAVGIAATLLWGCNGGDGAGAEETGRVEMALSAATANGTYRLVGSRFQITGITVPSSQLLTQDDLATSLTVSLPAGQYLVELTDGWILQRQGTDGGEPTTVLAELVSESAVLAEVRAMEATSVRFRFRVNGAELELGPGNLNIGIDIDDATDAGTGAATPPLAMCHDSVVISQVYSGGGNGGATYANDFIELHNRGAEAMNLSGWSVQYTFSGSVWQVTPLPDVLLPPGGFLLVREGSSGAVGASLPAYDVAGNISLGMVGGTVALVSTSAPLVEACPRGGAVVDLVGYGNASCFEGTPAATSSAAIAVARLDNGCADSNHNATDTAAGLPVPRSFATPSVICTCP